MVSQLITKVCIGNLFWKQKILLLNFYALELDSIFNSGE
jgi:hypothetical protein